MKYYNKKMIKNKLFFLFILFLAGCAISPIKRQETTEFNQPLYNQNYEIEKQVNQIITTVEKICLSTDNLDLIGKKTMKQSQEIMDIGKDASLPLIKNFQNSDNYKLRYWIVDILGYLQDERNLYILEEIVQDEEENFKVRKKAAESILEINPERGREILEKLIYQIQNVELKEEIAGYILDLK